MEDVWSGQEKTWELSRLVDGSVRELMKGVPSSDMLREDAGSQ